MMQWDYETTFILIPPYNAKRSPFVCLSVRKKSTYVLETYMLPVAACSAWQLKNAHSAHCRMHGMGSMGDATWQCILVYIVLLKWIKTQYIIQSASPCQWQYYIYTTPPFGRSILVGVTGFKLTISMFSLIRWSYNLVEVLFEVLWTCVSKDFVRRCFVAAK